MTDAIDVRPAGLADLDTVVAFNRAMAHEAEGLALEEQTLTAGVEWALLHPDSCPYFLAERSGSVVGQCMVTYEWSDWCNGWVWWFQSVYVHPDHRRSGVFRRLFEHVETLARQRGDVRGLRLYVEKANQPAMRTYSALGMRPSGHVVYEYTFGNVTRQYNRPTGCGP